jgi:DNA-binding response OmpR family regulator
MQNNAVAIDRDRADASAPRLLVVDDDLIQRRIIARFGAQTGFLVDEATSFEEAQAALGRARYGCVTLDLSLGEHDGVYLLRTIAENNAAARVVVVSGASESIAESTLAVARQLGLDAASINKPLKIAALRDALELRYRICAAAGKVDGRFVGLRAQGAF